MPSTAVVWFRRDLRLHDHPALRRAVEKYERILPLFVVDDALVGGRWPSPNRLWFMASSVQALAEELRERGAPLTVLRGRPSQVVPEFAAAAGAQAILVSRDYAPYGRRRDAKVERQAHARGIHFDAQPGVLVHEPEAVQRAGGGPFTVFSPFCRAWEALPLRSIVAPPKRIVGATVPGGATGSIWDQLGSIEPTASPQLLLEPGEGAARGRLADWAASDTLDDYDEGRDRLDRNGTSRLSQDLRWGLLSPLQVLEATVGTGAGRRRFQSEICWRDFYAHLLWHQPRVAKSAFVTELEAVAWETDEGVIQAWRDGRTGYPVVDAAMRQLAATGWMHNRARMITASFLTKDLGVDWRVGEAHFMSHLLDGDPASNNGGWQWASSTGTDAQPYFRIFNPTLQARRHDPDGDYVRRWLPELTDQPGPAVHEPPAGTYLPLIVDHAAARRRALDAYGSLRRPR
ncbi:deoxyribodipyrimidine photo-lyase [soil metagenome]